MKKTIFALFYGIILLALNACQKSEDTLSQLNEAPQALGEMPVKDLLNVREELLKPYVPKHQSKLVFQGQDSLWVEESTDYYIVDGDMLLPKSAFSTRPSTAGELRGALFTGSRPWSNRIVYYQFASNLPTQLKNNFLLACREWNRLTGINFQARTNQSNYIWVFPGGEDRSALGMAGGRQELSLNDGNAGVAIHELGHALGMAHEHQRSDRNNYIYVHPSVANQSNFSAMRTYNYSSFDFNSIMLYESKRLSNGQYDMVIRSTGRPFANRIETAKRKNPNNPNAYYALPSTSDVNAVKDLYY